MTNLKLKRLSEFIDDMIQKYQIEETKNIKKSLFSNRLFYFLKKVLDFLSYLV